MEKLWILGPLVFLAGFIDAIAGGGGLISLPAYIFAGIPIHLAMGTNKLSSSIGTFTASITYFIHKKIWVKLALISAFFALVGSWLGASMALWFSENGSENGLDLCAAGHGRVCFASAQGSDRSPQTGFSLASDHLDHVFGGDV